MKTKILVLMIMTLMSLSLKSQSLQALNDTNIVFYDFNPDSLLSHGTDILSIDMNQDGISDFKFHLIIYPFRYPFILNLSNNWKYTFFTPTDLNDTLKNSLLYWISGDAHILLGVYDGRIGVKLIVGNDYYYGWIHAYPVSDGTTNNNLIVDKYAFCKIPNYPFLYGQTEIVTHVPIVTTPDSTNVYLNSSGTGIVVQSGKIIQAVSITSPTGAVVATQSNINADSATIGTKGLAHGAYIVQVQFLDKSICTKQIVL